MIGGILPKNGGLRIEDRRSRIEDRGSRLALHAFTFSLIAAEQHIRGALALFRQIDIPGEIAATEQLLADLDARQSAGRHKTSSS